MLIDNARHKNVLDVTRILVMPQKEWQKKIPGKIRVTDTMWDKSFLNWHEASGQASKWILVFFPQTDTCQPFV